ncbi:unnamed protein product [Rotaria sordida]|uniref:Uncharacterized protein n=1 Tax=Rotaria sordida TaxID=392033 RepID=A0A815UNU4_9BILA|nr:unnamed protein product [Rotaria sordida]
MPVSSSTDTKTNPYMNTDEFFEYLEKRYNNTFAVFICKELQIITPSILTVLTIKELNDLAHTVYPDLKSCSVEYYTGDHADKNGNHQLKHSIVALIQVLKNEFSLDRRKRGRTDPTTTNSSEMSEAGTVINKNEINLSNDKHIGKRKRRYCKVESSNHYSSNIEWSFSSDEYQPPSLEQLHPNEDASAQERADFELLTNGRMDYFCQKYLFLMNVNGMDLAFYYSDEIL